MIVLGIYPGHNAAVCLVRDGEVLINLELERFSRIKHDYGYREDFLEFCLRSAGVAIGSVDLVALNRWADNPYKVREGTRIRPCEIPSTAGRAAVPFTATILGRSIPGVAVNHHLAHVAGAYYTSPFDESAVFTIDGGGDAENASVAFCRGGRVESFSPLNLETLCWWWSSLTFNNYRMPRFHEWDPGSGAGKLMALAAYGSAALVRERFLQDVRLARQSPSYTDGRGYAFNDDENLSDTKSPRSQALAAALQEMTEEKVTRWFEETHRRFPSRNLCYAGGLALNCIANTKALKAGPFERLHVPPCPNDTGLALGMALYAYHHHAGNPRRPGFFSPYTGPAYAESDIDAAIASARGAADKAGDGFDVGDASVEAVCEAIKEGEVVCVWRQRSECGPRALGHRSLLCRPDVPGIRDHLNFKVKQREWYRPYAPIVLAEHAGKVFENYLPDSPYMTTSAYIRPEWREFLAGVNHVDNSTRPQIIAAEHEPFIHAVLTRLHRLTGIPVVLNTSFNRKTPIVETPAQAVETFLEMPVKYLVLGDKVLARSKVLAAAA